MVKTWDTEELSGGLGRHSSEGRVSVLATRIDSKLASNQDIDAGEPGTADRIVSLPDLDELVRSYGTRVQRFCGSLTGDQDEAHDLAQDVFVVAMERRTTFKGDASVETWLLGIAVRVCRNWCRRRAVRRRLLRLFYVAHHDSASDSTSAFENLDEIACGLRALDVKSREVLVLRYFEGLEMAELASVLRLSRSAVEQRLSRARRKLAEWLER